MPPRVDFIFDFASPNAYLAHHALSGIAQRTGAEVRIQPCLLGGIFKATGNQAPFVTFGNVKGKLDYERLETERFIEKHQLKSFRFNPHFPVNTLMLMRGAIVAEEDGRLPEYVDAGLRLMWEEGAKLDDAAVLTASLSASGFDGASILERTQQPEIKQRLVANTEAAVARGSFGIPTFYVGDEMFFGKERLGQIEEALGGAS